MKGRSSRARRGDLNAHSTAWGRLSSALNRRVSPPDCRTSSETFSGVLAIFAVMIARGAGIDTTIPSALAFKRTPRRQRAFDALKRRETADPRPFQVLPGPQRMRAAAARSIASGRFANRVRTPPIGSQVRTLGSRAIGLRTDRGSIRLSGQHRRCFA